MAIRKYKPTSPGRRFQTCSDFKEITKSDPEKSLLRPLKKSGGRNCYGRMTSRHIGGGHKQKYRLIDFRRDKPDVPGKVVSIEYDPNRTSRIALIQYRDGDKRYIIAPNKVGVGDVVISGETADIKPGNTVPLKNMPLGSL
ncbi:MAG: 50S ribosomal protein L2, partial [Deltaproteobacteria bacterium HGW-Deltaproteobacteria-9]